MAEHKPMILVSGDPIKCNNGLKYGVDVTTTKYILYPARAFKKIPIHSNHPNLIAGHTWHLHLQVHLPTCPTNLELRFFHVFPKRKKL